VDHKNIENGSASLGIIRPCEANDLPEILRIINAAAAVYRGVIPADRWHEPYMPVEELRAEMAAGVRFSGYFSADTLIGVMGIQQVRNVRLIRHAYVLPEQQGQGAGSKLLGHLRSSGDLPILIGTWSAANWAIRFYERHGFGLVPHDAVARLLQTYWDIPDRQIETSVVLASPSLSIEDAARLIAKG
jgi:GNAT superfamily N-acetyltransferase